MEYDNERGAGQGSPPSRPAGGASVSDDRLVSYVLNSSVRTDVLEGVVDDPVPTEALIERVDASESAVYNALRDLERRGLVRSVDDCWGATGSGHLVADLIEQQGNLCPLLSDDYWRTHDVGALPRRFRIRLTELADAEVYRGSDTDPHAVVREVVERVEAASPDVDIVSPIYQAEYEAVMPDSERSRLLLDRTVVEEALQGVETVEEARTYERTPIRILDVDVGVAVTPDHLMLSLPTIDGQYDSRAEVIATDDRAIAWGEDLFEHYWNLGHPVEEFLADYFQQA